MARKHHGSSLDNLLKGASILAAVEATAIGLHGAGVMSAGALREFEQFRDRLSRPAAPNDRLRRTRRAKAPWKSR